MLNYIQVLGIPTAANQLAAEGANDHALHEFAQHAWNVANDRCAAGLCGCVCVCV
jgi:hypothetical protein